MLPLGLLMLRWGLFISIFWALAVELSSLAIVSNLTKRSQGSVGLFTSSVEMVFLYGQ